MCFVHNHVISRLQHLQQSCLRLLHNDAKQSFACARNSPGALTCLCCLHSLLALQLDELIEVSRLPYFVFIVRKMWKIDRV